MLVHRCCNINPNTLFGVAGHLQRISYMGPATTNANLDRLFPNISGGMACVA